MFNSAKAQAVADIMQDLHKNGKAFLAFRKDLNETMDELVNEQLEQQKSLSHR